MFLTPASQSLIVAKIKKLLAHSDNIPVYSSNISKPGYPGFCVVQDEKGNWKIQVDCLVDSETLAALEASTETEALTEIKYV